MTVSILFFHTTDFYRSFLGQAHTPGAKASASPLKSPPARFSRGSVETSRGIESWVVTILLCPESVKAQLPNLSSAADILKVLFQVFIHQDKVDFVCSIANIAW